ncbi:MAG: hypothetical protein F4Z36_04725 [Acidimicrobiia bacterium]|nr:hypothetical protein [Acidimicrobiia bacterium]
MPNRVTLTALLILLSGLLWAGQFLFGGSPRPVGASSLTAIGLLTHTGVIVVAMILSPGLWVRRTLVLVGAGWVWIALTIPLNPAWVAALVSGVAGIGLAWTKGMDEWFYSVKPDRVPPQATILALGLVWLPGLVGMLGMPDLGRGGWVLGGAGLVWGWAYARTLRGALWTIRLGLLPLGILAAIGLNPWAATGLVGYVGLLTYLSWTSDARLSVERPPPRVVKALSVLPEVTPPDLLRQAGYSRTGRPLKDPD